jgi:hypothetical protein
MKKPTVVAIIGSTKFRQEMEGIAQRETIKGKIVLLPGFYHHSDRYPISSDQKRALDELLMRKIDLSDEVIVCNVNGYIGETSRRAIAYTKEQLKPIRNEWDIPNLVPAATASRP